MKKENCLNGGLFIAYKPHPMKPRQKEPKVQIPAQKLNISEETVAADSGKKEHTPVIKTENKKQRTKQKTKAGSWKYAVMGIGLLALVGAAGAITIQKRPNSDPAKKVVTAEPTATPTPTPKPTATPRPTPTADEIMSQKWEQVYYVLDEMTSQGIFSYIGKSEQELQEYLLAQGWEVTSENEYTHLQTGEQIQANYHSGGEITSISVFSNSTYCENSAVDLGSAEELRKADNREEIYDLLGITHEMIEWGGGNNGQKYRWKDGSLIDECFVLYFNENWKVCMQLDKVEVDDGSISPYIDIYKNEKGFLLLLDGHNKKKLDCIEVYSY